MGGDSIWQGCAKYPFTMCPVNLSCVPVLSSCLKNPQEQVWSNRKMIKYMVGFFFQIDIIK